MTEVQHKQTIGRILLDSGKLNPEDADRIINTQKKFGLRFGDAAIKLGLLSEDDISQAVSQQFDYSFLTIDDESIDKSVIAAFQSFGNQVEALRSLRSQLSLRWFTDKKSLVITGARAGQGASYVSANLAVMFAQLGYKTLLIDADMRNPTQQGLFKNANRIGLSDLLANRSGMDCIKQINGIDNLAVLFSGTTPPNSLELMGNGRFLELNNRLSEAYDVIIVDTPPMLEYSDSQLLASVTGGSVIVAKKHNASFTDLEKAKKQIAVAGAEPVGVVFNAF